MRTLIVGLLMLSLAGVVHADSLDFIIDYDKAEDTDQANVAVGVGATGKNVQLYGTLGLGNLAEEQPDLEEQIQVNVSAGLRLVIDSPRVKPFAGVSARFGSISDEIPAENDDIDNDDDGAVDEDGEVAEVNLYQEFTFFGELGARIELTEPVSIILNAKYPIYWSEGERDEWFYGFSLVLSLHDQELTPIPREEEQP